MLTCRELTELVTDYLEGQLPLAESLRFRIHLFRCPPCRVYLQQMKETIETLGHLPPEPLSCEAKEQLMACFRDWKKGDG